jgi:signal transduction histidine kinase
VTAGRLPETNALAVSFNAMLDSLNESQASLERVHRKMLKQRALADMGKFSLMIAHEFKNPLGIIKSSLDILKKDIDMNVGQTMVDYIEDEIVRLNRLIEDFLLFSKPVDPVLREVDLNQTFADVAQRIQMIYSEEDIHFILKIPSTAVIASADRDLLIRAFGNIIENACEAVLPCGKIELTATVEDDTRFWKALIADTGTGLDPGITQKIFDPFFTTRAKGTGLGLAFVAQVIKSHHGFVMAENRTGGGALFTVEIPMVVMDPPSDMIDHRSLEGSRRMN